MLSFNMSGLFLDYLEILASRVVIRNKQRLSPTTIVIMIASDVLQHRDHIESQQHNGIPFGELRLMFKPLPLLNLLAPPS